MGGSEAHAGGIGRRRLRGAAAAAFLLVMLRGCGSCDEDYADDDLETFVRSGLLETSGQLSPGTVRRVSFVQSIEGLDGVTSSFDFIARLRVPPGQDPGVGLRLVGGVLGSSDGAPEGRPGEVVARLEQPRPWDCSRGRCDFPYELEVSTPDTGPTLPFSLVVQARVRVDEPMPFVVTLEASP